MESLRHFGFLLKDVARLYSRNFERRAVAGELGLTIEQCRVLVHLERNQGVSQARLACLTETDPMTLVRIVDRIERNGWIERRRDPSDRRVWRLHLLPAARPVLKRIWATAEEARGDAVDGLSANQTTQLLRLLNKVQGNLAALLPGATGTELRPTKSGAAAGRRVTQARGAAAPTTRKRSEATR